MSDQIGKKYYLQLRGEENVVRMVRYVGRETRPAGDMILLEERGPGWIAMYVLEKSKFLIEWRTWNRPPRISWIRSPWKEQDSICPDTRVSGRA